jgi:hypothetical protein
MPVDMSLKSGSLEIRVKRGDLIHDTSKFLFFSGENDRKVTNFFYFSL